MGRDWLRRSGKAWAATWVFVLNLTTAERMSSTTYLIPPMAILLAWLILGEVPPVIALDGQVAGLASLGCCHAGMPGDCFDVRYRSLYTRRASSLAPIKSGPRVLAR